MNALLKIVVGLVGLMLVFWAAVLLGLGFAGETVAAQNVQTRRSGGERDDGAPNRYTYSVSYEFVTKAGDRVEGRTQLIGTSIGPGALPRRVNYFASWPFLNAPEEQCGVGGHSLVLGGAGGLVLWGLLRGGKGRSRKRGSARGGRRKATRGGKGAAAPLAESAEAWLRRYRRNARRYAWFFFVVVVVGIGTLVRLEFDGWEADWFYATGFAALVTWVLAWRTRAAAESSWEGVVSGKRIKEVRRSSSSGDSSWSHIVDFEKNSGRRFRLRVGAELFGVYEEGMEVEKVAGLLYPIPVGNGGAVPFCPVCGGLMEASAESCPRCRAPAFRTRELRERDGGFISADC